MTIRLPDPPDDYDVSYMRELVRSIEQQCLGQVAGTNRLYQLTNFKATRAIDLNTATQEQINNFLITLANDLIQRSLLA